jgi:uncharacterized protein with PQ loop repeat
VEELAVWLPFETLLSMILGVILIMPISSPQKEKSSSNNDATSITMALFLISSFVYWMGAGWAWLWHVNFGWDFSTVGIPISLLNGIGLVGSLLIWWNALVTYRNKPA